MDNGIIGYSRKITQSFSREDTDYIPGFDDLPAAKPRPLKPMDPPPDFLVTHEHFPAKQAKNLLVPPRDIAAEQAVLGGLMIAPDKLNIVKNIIIGAEDFYRIDHQVIYQAICKLAEKGVPVDPVTIGDWFLSHNLDNRFLSGDASYIIELSMTTPSAANIHAYAEIVRAKAAMRQLLKAGQSIIESVHQPDGKSANELLTDANLNIANLCKDNMRGGDLKLMESGLQSMVNELYDRQTGKISGIIPQWKSVKNIIPKLEAGYLMILAARPGMGKTANALQWALHAAENQQTCAVFSLEMGTNQLLMRALSTLSNIPLSDLLRENGIADEQWSRVTEALRKMQAMPLAINDSGRLTVEQIRAQAIQFHSQCKDGLKLIVIDYLQLITASNKKQANRNEEIAHISRELKGLAKELKCPVIALSQLNRAIELRADKTPNLADLRDSGAIEADADLVAFLYRPAYYGKDTKQAGHDENDHAQNNINNVCSFNIAKNRYGPTGHATLRAELEYCRFQDGTGLNVATAEQNLGVHQQYSDEKFKKAA